MRWQSSEPMKLLQIVLVGGRTRLVWRKSQGRRRAVTGPWLAAVGCERASGPIAPGVNRRLSRQSAPPNILAGHGPVPSSVDSGKLPFFR